MAHDPSLPPSAESLALRHEIAAATQAVVIGEVVRLIAHDINQPLAAIVANGGACLRWLERDPPNVAEAAAVARRLGANAQRAAETMREIQARVQRQPPPRTVERVADLVATAVELVAPTAAACRVHIEVEPAADGPAIEANRAQLLYVLMALLGNACEALEQVPEPRRVQVGCRRTDGEVELWVRDNGPGLGVAGRNRHFEPFFTLERDGLGLGLGLAVSRAIVDAHGGRLAAVANPGGGESFVLAFPARP